MLEMSFSGKQHGDAGLVGFLDGIFVANGSARLDDGLDPIVRSQGNAVIEREETVGGEHQPGLAGDFISVSTGTGRGRFASERVAASLSDFRRADTVIWPAPTP